MTRSTSRIEHELAETRRDMARTINELQTRVSPKRVLDAALGQAKRAVTETPRAASHEIAAFGKDVASGLSSVVRGYPVPVAMLGIGLAWLMLAGRKSSPQPMAGRAVDGTGHAPAPVAGPAGVNGTTEAPATLSRES